MSRLILTVITGALISMAGVGAAMAHPSGSTGPLNFQYHQNCVDGHKHFWNTTTPCGTINYVNPSRVWTVKKVPN